MIEHQKQYTTIKREITLKLKEDRMKSIQETKVHYDKLTNKPNIQAINEINLKK